MDRRVGLVCGQGTGQIRRYQAHRGQRPGAGWASGLGGRMGWGKAAEEGLGSCGRAGEYLGCESETRPGGAAPGQTGCTELRVRAGRVRQEGRASAEEDLVGAMAGRLGVERSEGRREAIWETHHGLPGCAGSPDCETGSCGIQLSGLGTGIWPVPRPGSKGS